LMILVGLGIRYFPRRGADGHESDIG
jgi:hypothetical protein